MVNECLVQKILANGTQITLGNMLREFRRSATPFIHEQDEEWEELSGDFMFAVDKEYCFGIRWTRRDDGPIDPEIWKLDLPSTTIVPPHITEKYIRCNVYCAEYLQKRAGR